MADIRLARLGDGRDLARLRWEFAAEDHEDLLPLPDFEAEFGAFLARALDEGRWGIWLPRLSKRSVSFYRRAGFGATDALELDEGPYDDVLRPRSGGGA